MDVVGAAQPAKLHIVRFDGHQSVVESFEEAEIETKRLMLEEVGASLADVFSAERVIWVEGPTERECFNWIVAEELNGPIVGLSFVALRNTGDLEGKQSNAALDIYSALTQGGAIFPVTLWFSFDLERRSVAQREDLIRRCDGRAKFLPRRMIENYFLNPTAIVSVLNELGEVDIKIEKLEELLRKHAPRHFPKGSVMEYGNAEFFINVDGANLLGDVFQEVSDARQSYRKIIDGLELLKQMLKKDRASIEELIHFVRGLL
jgi:hypothetical protein